jgi:DNA-binding IscR family transcriptional regulator
VRGECGQTDRCTIKEPLRRVNESIEQVLRRISISEMKDDTHAHEETEVKKLAELVTIT